jgi:hypothetical protein
VEVCLVAYEQLEHNETMEERELAVLNSVHTNDALHVAVIKSVWFKQEHSVSLSTPVHVKWHLKK